MNAALTTAGMILSVGNRLMNSKTAMLDVDGDANITGNVTIGGAINLGSITTGNVR